MITQLILLWMAALALFVPPLTCAAGKTASLFPAISPPVLLCVCCAAACMIITLLFAYTIKRIGSQLQVYLPTPAQTAILVFFGVCITVPRLIALGPDMPLAIYDDNWHYQKIVSLFSTFPNVSHYLFPELKLSYYFYGYVIPAALYGLKTGISLKIIWVSYLFMVVLALYLLILTCCNTLLPRSNRARTLFALMITFLGGLHEWPCLAAAVLKGLPNWHTEWWAQTIGLDLQVSSFYTACFWAPQHICGLAIFSLILVLLTMHHRAWIYLTCGLLAGIQAGFSAYVALATIIYVVLTQIRPSSGSGANRLNNIACFGIGFSLAIMPIADCFIGRQNSITFAPRFSQIAEYLLFLFVEFGVMLVLLALCARGKRNHVFNRAQFFVDTLFIGTILALLFCVKSSGFNVLSYRILLPAQVLLGLYAVLQLEQLKDKKNILKFLLTAVLAIQVTGFAPEMIALAKKNYAVRKNSFRLPETVVAINQSRELDEIISIPYRPEIDTVWLFNTLINNIFRLKNIDPRYFCNGTLDPNNLVYLNSDDTLALHSACKTKQNPASLPESGPTAATEK